MKTGYRDRSPPFLDVSLPFISITRLRIRSFRFLPAFLKLASHAVSEVKRAPGFQGGSLLADRKWAFWTMTSWESERSMQTYMTAGAHQVAMPKLLDWCDEASIVHWMQTESSLPTWREAEARMRREGRASRVRNPSVRHQTLQFAKARIFLEAPIHPARD